MAKQKNGPRFQLISGAILWIGHSHSLYSTFTLALKNFCIIYVPTLLERLSRTRQNKKKTRTNLASPDFSWQSGQHIRKTFFLGNGQFLGSYHPLTLTRKLACL